MAVKKAGYYFRTEIDGKWYSRYMGSGMLARGRGKYWIDDKGLHFLRYLTLKPLFIPFADLIDVKTGTWHSGKWGQGHIVIKLLWSKDSLSLSSGFILSTKKSEAIDMVEELMGRIKLS